MAKATHKGAVLQFPFILGDRNTQMSDQSTAADIKINVLPVFFFS